MAVTQANALQTEKNKGDRHIMMERPSIVAQRHRYLREIRQLSESGHPLIFLDETWVNAHHTVASK